MQHKNESTQFIKIPKNWENISWEKRNLYIAYLFVKRYSRFGRVHRSLIPKRHFHHWITKLTSAGLMRLEGSYYVLIGYAAIWEILKIKKVRANKKSIKTFRFHKIVVTPDSWGLFKKKLQDDIQGFQAERKLAQFRRRLKIGDMSTDKTRPLFSAQAAAKLFGYKTRVTGGKYREKYFDVVKEPLIRRLKFTSDHYPYFQFDCKRIELKKIYHEG